MISARMANALSNMTYALSDIQDYAHKPYALSKSKCFCHMALHLLIAYSRCTYIFLAHMENAPSNSEPQWHMWQEFQQYTHKTSKHEISGHETSGNKTSGPIMYSYKATSGHMMSQISLTIFTKNEIGKL